MSAPVQNLPILHPSCCGTTSKPCACVVLVQGWTGLENLPGPPMEITSKRTCCRGQSTASYYSVSANEQNAGQPLAQPKALPGSDGLSRQKPWAPLGLEPCMCPSCQLGIRRASCGGASQESRSTFAHFPLFCQRQAKRPILCLQLHHT